MIVTLPSLEALKQQLLDLKVMLLKSFFSCEKGCFICLLWLFLPLRSCDESLLLSNLLLKSLVAKERKYSFSETPGQPLHHKPSLYLPMTNKMILFGLEDFF